MFYCNYGSYFGAEDCVEVESEPGVVGWCVRDSGHMSPPCEVCLSGRKAVNGISSTIVLHEFWYFFVSFILQTALAPFVDHKTQILFTARSFLCLDGLQSCTECFQHRNTWDVCTSTCREKKKSYLERVYKSWGWWKWNLNGKSIHRRINISPCAVSFVLPARLPKIKGAALSRIARKCCFSANDLSCVCRKSRLAIHHHPSPFFFFFFWDRGDTMIALPSLPLESPLLLLLPSVPVAHVRLHSGLLAPGYFVSAANGVRLSCWGWGEKTRGLSVKHPRYSNLISNTAHYSRHASVNNLNRGKTNRHKNSEFLRQYFLL